MIRLQRLRGTANIPPAFKAAGQRKKAELLAKIFFEAKTSGKPMKFDSAKWKPAKKQLKDDTNGKCAYCEAPTDAVAHGDVEHFRPKSIYWWLAFCFDNYLYSCQICNQSYKSNHFPISGERLAQPEMPDAHPADADLEDLIGRLTLDPTILDDDHFNDAWSGELADIPNPYLEDPEQLFVYEIDPLNREVWVRSAGGERADRAMKAADAHLGLNREALRRDRFVYLGPLIAFRQVLELPDVPDQAAQIAREQIAAKRSGAEPFAGMCRYFATSWRI